MKAVILAGGRGTRLSELTLDLPKPMVEIGGRPILWHIMKIYSSHGIKDFIICLGYKGHLIKEYFVNYYLHTSDITVDIKNNGVEIHNNNAESWMVTLVDTGESTLTGGRLKRVRDYVADEPCFCFTYGDGVGDVDISESIKTHQKHGKLATVAATRPLGRFGAMELEGDRVLHFQEKPKGDGSWINGGFFVLSPPAIDYVDGDDTPWERQPLERLARDDNLRAYYHDGFWHPMDTLRDKNDLEHLYKIGAAPWVNWS